MFTLKLKFLRNLFIFLFLAASGLSFGTKEIVVVTPFLLIIVDWFFLAQEEWCFFKTRIWFHLIYSLLFFSIFINYLNPKFAVDIFTLQTATGNNRGNVITPHAYDFITPYYFFITQFCVILHYLFIFIWPFGISVEYDWHLASSFFSPNVLFSFLFMVGILIVVCYLAYKKSLGFFPFGILWFLISLAPRTSIIPSPELMFDYKTYLASVGLLFILAATIVFCFFELYKKLGTILRGLFLWPVPELLAMIFIVPLGIFTLLQNKTWETQVSFWEYNAKMAPQKARVHNNFGVALCEAGRYDDAISEYKKAIALDNYYSDPLSNIAVAYSLKGDIDNAINSLKLAIHLCPNYAEAYNNLGSLFVKKKEYATAEQILKHAIQIRPYYGKAYYNLGRLYLEKGNEEQAWSFFKKAVEGDLDNPDGFFAFGQISLKLKKYKDAVYAFEWIVKSGFVTDQVLFSLGNSYFMIQDYDRAEKIYNDIVRNNPSDFRYIYNLAETYFMKKNYFRALELFRRVTALPNPHPPALFRVANCLEHLKKYKEAKDYLQSILSSVKIVDKSGDINKAESVKEKFIKEVKSLIAQIDLHEKVENGKGTVTLAELNKSLALAKK
jgi:tetratricopeptide (TPR) repeat protein